MATFGATCPKPLIVNPGGPVRHYEVASGQTFVAGDFVYLDASSQLVIAAAPSAAVGDVRLFIAQGNAADALNSDLATKLCGVIECRPGTEAMLQVYHATPASAVIAQTDTDTPLTLPLVNIGGVWGLDIANDGSANSRCIVLEKAPNEPWSEPAGTFKVAFRTTKAFSYE